MPRSDAYAGDVGLESWILAIIHFAAILVAAYALVHAAMQRADAFTAADKLTKPAWLGISGGAVVALLLPTMIFWIAGLVAALVYMVDVRPKVTEVQKGRP